MTDFKKPNNLDRVEQSLYSTNSDIRKKPRHELHEKEYSIEKDWTDEINPPVEENPLKKENKRGLSLFTKIFIGAFSFFLLALGYAFYMFFYHNSPELNNVDITINSPVSVAAGEQFNYDINIANNNSIKMETVDLVIEYPSGTRDGKDVSIDLPRERTGIGSIDPGTVKRETRSVFLFGETGETKEISVKVVYRAADSNALFEKKKVFDVVLKSTPIRMNVSTTKEITSGQDLGFDVEIVSNSNETLNNVLVKAEYPFGFIFGSSDYPDQIDNNTWLIKKINPQEVVKFKVSGQLQGQNNEARFFRFSAGLMDSQNQNQIGVLFTSIGNNIEVSRPFLEIDLAINRVNSSVIKLSPDNSYEAKVSYKNNTNFPVKDVDITLQLNGETLDESSIQVDGGFYRSIDNTILWDKTTKPEFDNLGVGRSGELSFNFRAKESEQGKVFKNPEIKINAKVKGFRYSDNNVPEEVSNEVFKTLRFDTNVALFGRSLYYGGPFTNVGQIPPKAEKENTYTIMFDLKNTANRISNGIMEMKIPNYVTFKDKVWPEGADIKFDSRERKVIWKIGEIREGAGYDQTVTSGAFQVGIIPSITQVGSEPILIDSIKFTGTDLFTGRQIQRTSDSISTSIDDSKNYYDGKVTK